MSLKQKFAATAVAGVLTFASVTVSGQEACGIAATTVTTVGKTVSGGPRIDPGNLLPVSYSEPAEHLRYFRVRLKVSAAPEAAWYLTIRDHKLRAIETYSSTLSRQSSWWTSRIDARSTVYFDLMASMSTVSVEIERAILMPEVAKNPYYSRQDENSFAFGAIEDAPSGTRRLGDHVGFLMTNWSDSSWCCSGVAVGENLFLTNWHCGGEHDRIGDEGMWSEEVCSNTLIDFSWDGDQIDREFVCDKVVQVDKARDFAVLRVRALNGSRVLRPPPIRAAGVVADEALVIVHHPACRPKQISLGCVAREAARSGWRGDPTTDFAYPCDTEAGSSGAPVFDKDSQLLGIHHLGFERNAAGGCDMLNKGVRIQSILDALLEPQSASIRALVR